MPPPLPAPLCRPTAWFRSIPAFSVGAQVSAARPTACFARAGRRAARVLTQRMRSRTRVATVQQLLEHSPKAPVRPFRHRLARVNSGREVLALYHNSCGVGEGEGKGEGEGEGDRKKGKKGKRGLAPGDVVAALARYLQLRDTTEFHGNPGLRRLCAHVSEAVAVPVSVPGDVPGDVHGDGGDGKASADHLADLMVAAGLALPAPPAHPRLLSALCVTLAHAVDAGTLQWADVARVTHAAGHWMLQLDDHRHDTAMLMPCTHAPREPRVQHAADCVAQLARAATEFMHRTHVTGDDGADVTAAVRVLHVAATTDQLADVDGAHELCLRVTRSVERCAPDLSVADAVGAVRMAAAVQCATYPTCPSSDALVHMASAVAAAVPHAAPGLHALSFLDVAAVPAALAALHMRRPAAPGRRRVVPSPWRRLLTAVSAETPALLRPRLFTARRLLKRKQVLQWSTAEVSREVWDRRAVASAVTNLLLSMPVLHWRDVELADRGAAFVAAHAHCFSPQQLASIVTALAPWRVPAVTGLAAACSPVLHAALGDPVALQPTTRKRLARVLSSVSEAP